MRDSVVQAGQQVRSLRPGPAKGLFAAVEDGHRGRRLADGEAGNGAPGELGFGEGGGVLVVVKHPEDGLLAFVAPGRGEWASARVRACCPAG